MEKQYLILGIHNHQPIGNFDFVFEECTQKAYLPFLKVLKSHPRIKISLHYSGNMWDWFSENSSPVLDLLHDMVARGQVELLSGGYYEPILAILPDEDKVGQIKKLNRYLSKHFQICSRGMWLAERVWEPHLVKYICEAGIEYLSRKVKGRGGVIVIDNNGNCASGFTTKKMIHGWIEHGGETMARF